jgi:cellulose synthase/poly-beta-1,6-N-acetylglucosamine synthase-like glycosyltransferase
MPLMLINAMLITLAILVLVPIGAFCIECLAAVLPRRNSGAAPSAITAGRRPRLAVLIPAHNEQLVIEQTLASVSGALAASDRLLVVADNCNDRTAELAHSAGAEVVVRNDSERRGKGYALQFGLRALALDPPEVVVVVDADCLVEPQTAGILARLAATTQRPVQALNLTDRNPATGPIQAVSLLGNHFTNLVRPLGLLRLGVPCRLTGTGMAFPWQLAVNMPLAGANLVEDMQLGIDLALRGHWPLFCAEARVTSALPTGDRAFVSQRTRWEHGHLHTAVTQIPRLLVAAVRQSSWRLATMALDLSIPPLTLLVAVWLTSTILSSLAWWLGGSTLPLALLGGGGAALVAALGLGWAVFCRRQVPLLTVVAVPHYMLCKLPIYAGFLVRRQHDWIRTERNATGLQDSPLVSTGKESRKT